jgi:hypothetical protein
MYLSACFSVQGDSGGGDPAPREPACREGKGNIPRNQVPCDRNPNGVACRALDLHRARETVATERLGGGCGPGLNRGEVACRGIRALVLLWWSECSSPPWPRAGLKGQEARAPGPWGDGGPIEGGPKRLVLLLPRTRVLEPAFSPYWTKSSLWPRPLVGGGGPGGSRTEGLAEVLPGRISHVGKVCRSSRHVHDAGRPPLKENGLARAPSAA